MAAQHKKGVGKQKPWLFDSVRTYVYLELALLLFLKAIYQQEEYDASSFAI